MSYSKVRAMTRVATPENETYLLMIATYGTTAHVERLVRQYRRVQRIEALQQANERHRLRELSWHYDENDCLVIKGRFPPEQGAAILKALDVAQEQVSEERKDVSAETSDEPERPVAARRADALERLAEAFLSGSSGQRTGGDRCQIQIHTDLDTLRSEGEGVQAKIDGGPQVSAETCQRLACDCSVVHLVEGGDGEILDVGRKTRSIPPSLRRALNARDGGCQFPGCTCDRFVDAHHVQHWADGGDTKLSNPVTLCTYHHRLVHEGGFGVHGVASGEFQFTRPDGVVIEPAPRSRFRGNVVQMVCNNRSAGLDLNPRTAEPYWHGEVMDDGMAVEGLLWACSKPS